MPLSVPNPPARSLVAVLALCTTASLPLWFATAPDQGLQPVSAPRPTAVEAVPADDLAGVLSRSRSAADSRNQAALTFCTAEITAILGRHFTDLYFTGESAAADVATYGNCVKVIAMLTSDQVRGRSDASEWVSGRIDGWFAPRIADCEQEIQTAIDRLDRELAASTLALATEFAAIGATGSAASLPEHAGRLEGLSLDAALGKLGFHGGLLTPAIALDIYGLMHTRIVSWLITKVVDMAKWIFARPLAAAVAEAGLVVADGPLPFGDAIAAVGAVWTAYDIYALRNHFEEELTTAIRESLPEARRALEQQIWAALRERVASHAELQARMYDETTRDLLP